MGAIVHAGNDCWGFFDSGILTSIPECEGRPDHGVTIVGFHHAYTKNSEADQEYNRTCRWALEEEREAG